MDIFTKTHKKFEFVIIYRLPKMNWMVRRFICFLKLGNKSCISQNYFYRAASKFEYIMIHSFRKRFQIMYWIQYLFNINEYIPIFVPNRNFFNFFKLLIKVVLIQENIYLNIQCILWKRNPALKCNSNYRIQNYLFKSFVLKIFCGVLSTPF